MNNTRRTLLATLAAFPFIAHTANGLPKWPSRVLKIIAPNPPGGAVDAVVRSISEQLSTLLGQSVIVENKPGAGGLLAVKAAAASTDQHTLVYINSGMVTLEAMGGRLDLLKELKPVARLSTSPMLVAVRSDSPFRTFADLAKAVKAEPGKYSYGSGGVGSPPHLAVGMLNEKLGSFDALHVPLKGAIESMTALIGGQIDFAVGLVGPLIPQIQAGKLRALAVTSKQRLPMLPNVPTIAESGVPDFSAEPWGGLALPANAPDAHVAYLNEIIPKALESAKLRETLAQQGSLADYAGAKEFSAQIERELASERQLVKRLNIKLE